MAHDRIRSLLCFAHVDSMIKSGASIESVASYIQDEARESLDVKRESLAAALSAYRLSLGELEIIGERPSRAVVAAGERLKAKISVREELECLYDWQKKRIQSQIATENKLGFPMARLGAEFKIASELLSKISDIESGYAKTGSLQARGVDNDALESVSRRYGDEARMALMNPHSRAKVLGIVERISTLAVRKGDEVSDSSGKAGESEKGEK